MYVRGEEEAPRRTPAADQSPVGVLPSMGISQLLPFIDSCAVERHLRDFRGQTCAIDGYYWLHRASKTCAMEMARGTFTTKFVQWCLSQVELLRHNGVEPLVVLDGAALPAKAGEEKHRRHRREVARAEAAELLRNGPYDKAISQYEKAVNITPEHAFQLICALRKHNVQYVVAPYEADAQLAKLARSGVVSLVLAEDSDMLAFGCPRVFTKMDATGFGKLIERSALATAREASTSGGSGGAGSPPLLFVPWAEWDGDGEDGGRFLELCILAGCDYLSHLPGMAMKTAFKQLRKYKTAERVVQVRQMEGNAPPPAGGYERYLRELRRAKQTFRHQRVYDMALRKVVPLNPEPPGAPSMPHCGADIDDAIAYRLCAIGDLHPDSREPLMMPPGMPPPPPLPPNHGMPRAQGVQPPPQLVLSEEPQQQFDLRQAASTFASAGSQQPVALQKPQLKPQPQLPQQLHLKPLDHRATVAGSSCAGRAAAASLGFTAAGAWPVGSTFNSTDSGGGERSASAPLSYVAPARCLGKRPSTLVQSSLMSSMRPQPIGSGGNQIGDGRKDGAEYAQTVSVQPPLPIRSNAEAKKPFKKPRSNVSDAASSNASSGTPFQSTIAGAKAALPGGGNNSSSRVARLHRSRFFNESHLGSSIGASATAAGTQTDSVGPLAAVTPALRPRPSMGTSVRAASSPLGLDEPETTAHDSAAHATLASFAFTPAPDSGRPRRSPRGHASSRESSGCGKARGASSAWEVFNANQAETYGENQPPQMCEPSLAVAGAASSSERGTSRTPKIAGLQPTQPLTDLEQEVPVSSPLDLSKFAHIVPTGRHRTSFDAPP